MGHGEQGGRPAQLTASARPAQLTQRAPRRPICGQEAVLQLACGRDYSIALTEDVGRGGGGEGGGGAGGLTVWGWGSNRHGQLMLADSADVPSPRPCMRPQGRVLQLSCGKAHTLVLQVARRTARFCQLGGAYLSVGRGLISPLRCARGQADGRVLGFGLNTDGQLGTGTTKDCSTPMPCQLGCAKDGGAGCAAY
jgi:alpha-tubulin suppressor-like RCC1 family protein